RQNNLKQLLSPAFLLFVLVGFAVIFYLGIRQPMLHEWDEYSLWGTIVKLMKLNNELYTTAPNGFAWATTQTPTLPALAYFVQFFGTFAVWKIYVAYALLLLSVVSALVGAVPLRQYQLAVPLAIVGLLTPWVFTVYARQYEAKFIWLSAYGDMPAGMLFGGALLLYFGLRQQKAPLWPVTVALAALALVKDNTFVFALAAAGIMVVDLLFAVQKSPKEAPKQPFAARLRGLFGKNTNPLRQPGSYTITGWLGHAALFLGVAAAPYMLWGRYIGKVVSARQAAGMVDPASESPFASLLVGAKMLFGLEERTEWFSETLSAMQQQFFWAFKYSTNPATGEWATSKVPGGAAIGMLGGGLAIVVVITLLFLTAVVLAQNNKMRLRIAAAYVCSWLCFLGYSFELLISFVFILGEGQGLTPSYNRYMYGYYIAWFLLAVWFLAQAAQGRSSTAQAGQKKLAPGLAGGAVLALAALLMLRSNMMLPLQNSDIGYPVAAYSKQHTQAAFAASVANALEEDPQRIFFVSQGEGSDLKWFQYHFYLLPHVIDYSGVPQKVGGAGGGGGTYTAPELLNGENPLAYNTYSQQELQAYITQNNCTYMLIEDLDERFIASYSSLFTDGLEQAEEGNTVLYKVQGAGSSLQFVPVPMEVPTR
ncbi:hypothetical protein LJC61_08590, partial [Ruminococcaceae bacterium OttesenSCG-928-A16]|nr:hypothetical protein [Ruminococcaceae bacterium OttesenSCG-928-A16]